MNSRIRYVPVLLAMLACVPAMAAAPSTRTTSKPETAQQLRMATCSEQNKGRKGADYRIAQSACLKGEIAVPFKARTSQQQRMTQCSALNKGRKGADYKTAQSACLKGDAPVGAKTPQQRMAQCAMENKGKKGADYTAAQSACLKKS